MSGHVNPSTIDRRPPIRAVSLFLTLPLVALALAASAAPPTLTPETQQVLVSAVEAAAALDFYNARCRSDGSGRHSDNLNKQLATKLHLTIISVQDDLFPERSFRAVQKRLQEQFTEDLRQAGGCKAAKDAGVPQQLDDRYRQGVTAIEALP